VRAVDGVSFAVETGQTFGLVGESGCGKSTVAGCILRLLRPDAGRVVFQDRDMVALEGPALRQARQRLSVVFQDPQSSLDPRMAIESTVRAPLRVQKLGRGRTLKEQVVAGLEEVGLGREHLRRYPHEFSGGQRQRIAVARALITNPDFIVLDEPTSALDVSVQAQVLNLLRDIQQRRDVSYLLISHDLTVVRHMSRRIGVMYLGTLVEVADTDALFDSPAHPYTQALLDAAPLPDPARRGNLAPLSGEAPSTWELTPGCAFASRCPRRLPVCESVKPGLQQVGPGHEAACHLVDRKAEHKT
jgi:oligopeptide/dipeptide ABC transporter ATP-binding protein